MHGELTKKIVLKHELEFGEIGTECIARHNLPVDCNTKQDDRGNDNEKAASAPAQNASFASLRQPTPPASKWCITHEQLMNIEQKAMKKFSVRDYPTRTMRDVCREIIEPKCNRTGTLHALHRNPQGLAADVFASHGWDGCFSAFCQSIRNAFQTFMVKPNLWICAFALVQGENEIVSKQMGSGDQPLEESPFVQAIQSASTCCVVRNSNMDTFSRIWCVCGELHHALRHDVNLISHQLTTKDCQSSSIVSHACVFHDAELICADHCGLFPTKTIVTGPGMFANMKTSVLDAQASRLQDRDRILRVLLTKFNRESIDDIVHKLRTQTTPEDSNEAQWCSAAFLNDIGKETVAVFCKHVVPIPFRLFQQL